MCPAALRLEPCRKLDFLSVTWTLSVCSPCSYESPIAGKVRSGFRFVVPAAWRQVTLPDTSGALPVRACPWPHPSGTFWPDRFPKLNAAATRARDDSADKLGKTALIEQMTVKPVRSRIGAATVVDAIPGVEQDSPTHGAGNVECQGDGCPSGWVFRHIGQDRHRRREKGRLQSPTGTREVAAGKTSAARLIRETNLR